MFQILITLLIYMVLVIPIGIYLYHVATKQRTFADPVFDRIDGMIYRICRINREDMHWKTYALNLLMTNAVMILIGYLVLRLQGLLFLNPNGIASMEESLSFNTIISFMTNTNLQHYSGESGLSYLSQTAVIIFMMFTSAATGYAACMAFCRGMAGRPMGNFYEDMVRNTTRILIPLSFIAGMLLIWQGTPQNFHANFTVSTLEGKWQDIATGPIAALEAIKHVGTNGGGFLGANSSTPLENPTIISNLVELYSMMILPGACVIAFGNMIADKRKKEGKKSLFGRQGRTVFAAMAIIFLIGVTVCFAAESAGNPVLAGIGLNQDMGSYEGKEVRFGIAQSALFTTTTTSFTTGTVNNMHDSLTPLGGLVPLLHMMLNCVFGGKGVGLMNMVMYVILAVFICGLMIGRTPEYLGKKIEGKEMKLVAVCLIIHPLLILGFSALAVSMAGGLAGITNPGFHGLSQVLYEYSSSAANNGSGFEGLADNSVFWNLTTGIAMYFGRFPAIILQLAIAGSIFAKRRVNETVGTLRTDNVVFTLILVFVVYIFAALTFFPALALGPVAEHLTIWFPGLS
ncbi:potassium-transporting ATPase subunit KdpA [[Clostridium] symbiosum]|uniref:Potassium-transporting ATPase potassium-binding subunit n=1 Tax=Clostridium symbiosum TaxID=1512 RepID=A0AAW6B2F4_CLOSY|nr:potassium-transporting ATPase subunit KdpA [[Clostridium] symbiosum]MDB1979808.1 potassium-transporting ATPase subunit KdpA [[Clostridium] symbiosum]MDB1984376.1 potassium-transporting ATPase subunit KdpA [[Clostridium] symbiosum]MDB1988939.1 potassium-transporting ATPase subunit KdpA [[Clostridium] symbiosum]MDB1993445.1 potassium-transporting ATPase subunit KdpA [[Clostridium] symbiosum]MDB1997883.1 potassium-transporting ATPase subunit KdpA [[Clostridium] symbiosum]